MFQNIISNIFEKADEVKDDFKEDSLPAPARAEANRLEAAILKVLLAKHDRREDPR